MATIRPFRALRFTSKAGDLQQLVCPPYDIIPAEARRSYLAQSPHNIIRLEKPEEGGDPYAAAGTLLRQWLDGGLLAQDEQAALYVYQMAWEGRVLEGVVARVKLAAFSEGVVLPHEETLSKAKEDRFRLMRATGCNFSDIYALYNAPAGVGVPAAEGAPQEVRDENGVAHRLWAVTDPAAIRAFTDGLADTTLYIADGHHRYETALRYRDTLRAEGAPADADSDYVMMMLVDMGHPGLEVLPTHRILHGLADFDAPAFLAACGAYFDVCAAPPDALGDLLAQAYTAGGKAFGFYAPGGAAVLTLRGDGVPEALLPGVSAPSRGLDVQVLHTLALERVLGIDKANMASQQNLRYARDWADAVAAVDGGDANAAFLLNPTRVEEIRDVAAAGEKMPQKSTYFYPKLITGLTMNTLG